MASRSEKNLEAAEVPPFNKPKRTKTPLDEHSMRGMPGYIKTGQGKDGERIARGHSSVGPKREGPIGQKGRANNEEHIYREGPGTIVKDYKSESTGKPGHYKMSGEGPGSEKGLEQKIGGHPGRMEKVAGRARTKAEGRRKSHMY